MKIHPWYLILGSIVIFLLNFLILANEKIFPGHEVEGISIAVVFICGLVFVLGIVWAIFEPIFIWKKSHSIFIVDASLKNQSALTIVEIIFNRLSAILLVLFTVPLFLNIITIPTIIIFITFAIFLWFGKKYHPFANFVFFIFALGIYFVPIMPLAWGTFNMLKEFRLSGFNFNFGSIFFITPLFFVSLSVRNVLGNIFVYLKTGTTWRNMFYFFSFLIIITTLLVYPFYNR